MPDRVRDPARDRRRGRVGIALAMLVALVSGAVPTQTATAWSAVTPTTTAWSDGRIDLPTELLDDVVDLVLALQSSQRFLDRYVAADGRVVRHDHDGDTVSEGQAYAMTVAAAVGDETTFRRVWSWTQRELRRDDALYSWRWADGEVVDGEPAADADLLIAGALSIAARRFDDPSLAAAARETSAAVLEHETLGVGDQWVLVAGPWAVEGGVINPSYSILPVMSLLWSDGEREWAAIAAGSRLVIDQLTRTPPHLPPDWAAIDTDPDGRVRAVSSGSAARYGWDAARLPVQLAADCRAEGRRIAARMWPFFVARDLEVAAVYETDGSVADPTIHPVALVGAAGSASAAGEREQAEALLDRAARRDLDHPTYFGAAWVALGRLWLTTSLLGGCADP